MEKQLLIKSQDLKPSREGFEILGVFNPGVIRFNDEIIMIARVSESIIQDDEHHFAIPILNDANQIKPLKIRKDDENYNFSDSRIIINHKNNYLTSISHFRIGRSKDGINFTFDDDAKIMPETKYEAYGIEDPRITFIDGEFYITYSGISCYGINVRLMKTKDFKTFVRLGNIFHSDNKDCVIFPEKINGKYFALHRPSLSQFGKLDIWLAQSNNLIEWGNHEILSQARVEYEESYRLGAGAVPFLTDKGWLVIYHIADESNTYHLAAMLLEKTDPSKVLMRSKQPLLQPTEEYEKVGFMNNVVFTCGMLVEEQSIKIYYGACDELVAVCNLSMADVFVNMEAVIK
jgi:predicted GH43/DUF377 family glycosyl hydrolase